MATAASTVSFSTSAASRSAQISSAAAAAARSATAGSRSATASTLAPTSGTSAQGKPWQKLTDRMPPRPSRAAMRSTMPRLGSVVVRHTPSMRQSRSAITGAVRPCRASSQSANRSSARAATSVCGYSL